jgi:hypothetical protein
MTVKTRKIPATDPSNDPHAAGVMTKALLNATGILGVRQSLVARILGVSAATVSRLSAGTYHLDPGRNKEWEFAVLVIRLFRSLESIVGSGEHARKWLAGYNLALSGKPIELIESTEGLVRVIHYLDAHRGRI